MLPATGSLCVLRRFEPTDLEPFLAYRSDPDVARFQSWREMGRDEAADFLQHSSEISPLLRPDHWTQIAIGASGDGMLCGDLGLWLSPEGREAEIGITLARAAQGRGIGGEALSLGLSLIFANSAAQKVWGITDIRNAPSLALLRRTGFRFDHEETADGLTEHFFAYDRPAST